MKGFLNLDQNIKISIIIPAYNVEKYINKSLESVCNQTYSNLEIIIIYDRSLDHTLEICQKWAEKDKRIRILVNDERKGLGSARNMGLKCASGKYIAYLDSDDWYSLDCIKTLFDIIEQTRANYVAFAGVYWVEENDIEVKLKHTIPAGTYESDIEKEIILLKDTPAVWKKMYDRNWLISNQLFEPEIYHYEDWGYNLPLVLCASKIVLVSGAGVYYRVNREGSLSNDNMVKIISDFKNSIEFGIKELEKRSILYKYRISVMLYFIYNYIIRKEIAVIDNNKEAIDLLEKIKNEITEKVMGGKYFYNNRKCIVFGSLSCWWIAQRTGILKTDIKYYGFSSIISAMTSVEINNIIHKNKFRENQVIQDVEGQFYKEMVKLDEKKILFIDFMEERHNLITDLKNFITESDAYCEIENKEKRDTLKIIVGSMEFYELWEQKCKRLICLLQTKKDLLEIFLIKSRLSLLYGNLDKKRKYPKQKEIEQLNFIIMKLEELFISYCKKENIIIKIIEIPETYKFSDDEFLYGCNSIYMNEILYTYAGYEIFKKFCL